MELKNRLVVITGVSKGIGLALVRSFLKRGAHVVGLGRPRPVMENSRFLFIMCDVRVPDQVEHSFEKIAEMHKNPVSVMVNNAGLGYFGYIENYSPVQIEELFETNVYSIFNTSRCVVPLMKKEQYGHIVNIASTAGLEAYPQTSAYCASNHAVKAISESMYKEMRNDRIKVTCVYPGSVKTDFFVHSESIKPHDYMLMPEDVAEMIVKCVETPDNFHQVSLEVRPLQPKGPVKS
jgi:short-subunit dehydrogenase